MYHRFSICNFNLWQRLKDSYVEDDKTWYANVPVGEKKLSAFMSDLSKAAGLSHKCTNHSSVLQVLATISQTKNFETNRAKIVLKSCKNRVFTIY